MPKVLKRKKRGTTDFNYICKTMKKAFSTRKAAKTYINMGGARDGIGLTAVETYKCQHCNFYHITSQRKKHA